MAVSNYSFTYPLLYGHPFRSFPLRYSDNLFFLFVLSGLLFRFSKRFKTGLVRTWVSEPAFALP